MRRLRSYRNKQTVNLPLASQKFAKICPVRPVRSEFGQILVDIDQIWLNLVVIGQTRPIFGKHGHVWSKLRQISAPGATSRQRLAFGQLSGTHGEQFCGSFRVTVFSATPSLFHGRRQHKSISCASASSVQVCGTWRSPTLHVSQGLGRVSGLQTKA